jgi:hypothetical protein
VTGIAISANVPSASQDFAQALGQTFVNNPKLTDGLTNNLDLTKVAERFNQTKSVDWLLVTPRPLAAVDNSNSVFFPFRASVFGVSGKQFFCKDSNLEVRQVQSCRMQTDAAEVDKVPSFAEIPISSTPQFQILKSKGFCVPGVDPTCELPPRADLTSADQVKLDNAELVRKISANEYVVAKISVVHQNPPNIKSTATITWAPHGRPDAKCTNFSVKVRDPQSADPVHPMQLCKGANGGIEKIPESQTCANGPALISGLDSPCSDRSFNFVPDTLTPSGLYMVRGILKTDKTEAECITQVAVSDVIQCPLLQGGGQRRDLAWKHGSMKGAESDTKIDFHPRRGLDWGWEVEAVARSPYDVDPCPENARCYAKSMDNWNPAYKKIERTPFFIVQDANLASCSVAALDRINLGCFSYDTDIMMADSRQMKIHAISQGDLVWNPVLRKPSRVVQVTKGIESKPLIHITTKSGLTQLLTTKHPVPTKGGLMTAAEVKPGDEILDHLGIYTTVVSVTVDSKPPNQTVWNVRLEGAADDTDAHFVVANGLQSGDLSLQERLEEAAKNLVARRQP